jgi:hypothetical protein
MSHKSTFRRFNERTRLSYRGPTGMESADMEIKIERKQVGMSTERFKHCSAFILAGMNGAIEDGYTPEEILFATTFLLGHSFAAASGVVPLDEPLRDALPSFADGYIECREQQHASPSMKTEPEKKPS